MRLLTSSIRFRGMSSLSINKLALRSKTSPFQQAPGIMLFLEYDLPLSSRRYFNSDDNNKIEQHFWRPKQLRKQQPKQQPTRKKQTKLQRRKNNLQQNLQQQINDCDNVRSVLDLCKKKQKDQHMKPFHVAACWDKVSRLVWDYKDLKILQERPKLLTPLLNRTIDTCGEMDSRSLSTTAHRMAKISSRTRRKMDSKIWNMLGDRAKEMTTFHPIEISNTVWAFAKIRFQAPELFDHLANEAIARVDSFNSRDISNMLWSYATLGHYPSPKLFDAAAGAIIEKLDEFNSQDISNTLWSYATVGHSSPELFEAAAEEAIKKINSFKPQAMCNMLWSYATVSHNSPKLFDTVAEEAIMKVHAFKSQEISNMLWSYATVGHPSTPKVFDMAVQQANEKHLHDFTEQGLCNTLWSLAAKNYDLESAIPLLDRVLDLHHSDQVCLSIDQQRQLHQVVLWVSKEHERKSPINDDFAEMCLSSFTENPTNPSELQKDVALLFRSLGLEVRDEAVCQYTGYSIDAIVTTKYGNEIAVEVDGPTHFVGFLPTGATMLKRRQLKKLGKMPLLSIPYWQWNKLGSMEEKQKFLEEEVNAIQSETLRL
mmetsp:Transcript_10748/g.16452  ORF Transcript_10748/g.16452 Transcript_10748/m.16452 type:complete len:596 (-) Transcript_10748:67-1854(-)